MEETEEAELEDLGTLEISSNTSTVVMQKKKKSGNVYCMLAGEIIRNNW